MRARARGTDGGGTVRMGIMAMFTLTAIICLSVLATLSLSTANATLTLAQRRAEATGDLYLAESAAQTFVGTLDGRLSQGAALDEALQDASAAARALGAGVDCDHAPDEGIHATFDCHQGRHLDVTLHLGDNGAPVVDEWRWVSVTNEEPLVGNLLGSS